MSATLVACKAGVQGGSNASTNTSTTSHVTNLSFPGISNIDQIAGDRVRLNWNHVSGATVYIVYDVTSGTPSYRATVVAPTANYAITGLSPGVTYRFRIRLVDESGYSDTNTNDVQATTLSVTATHGGWTGIKAVGPKVPAAVGTGISPAAAYVELKWNAVSLSSGTVSSYNLYRASSSSGFNFSSPLISGINATTRTATDNTVVAGATYYYAVAPVIGSVAVPAMGEADSELQIVVPPDNMVFVHRWAANQEMCSLMGRTSDRNNHYRCPYVGPTSVGGYLDLGRSFMIDAYETGCNYTPAPGCGDVTYGCIGTAAPGAGIGAVNDVYFDRSTGNCSVKRFDGNWRSMSSATTLPSERAASLSNKPGLPPVTYVSQNHASDACTGTTVTGFGGTKRLPSHREQIIASAWPAELSDAQIALIEEGLNLPGNHYCNTQGGSGITFDDLQFPADIETLGATLTGSRDILRSGSNSTSACISRYGVQDYVGNVAELASDQLANCDNILDTCDGITTPLDPTNADWNGFVFDGAVGPGAQAVTHWGFAEMLFNSTQFLVPLGLPLVTAAAASYDGLPIGAGAGEFNPTKFHYDHIWVDMNSTNVSRAAVGGGYTNHTGSSVGEGGRFWIDLGKSPTGTGNATGFRCVLPL